MAGYEAPSWGKLPDDEKDLFRLEVLKGGKIIQVIQLDEKDHFILGRQTDICDICLEHASISRKHAVLQYRDDNALMLLNYGGNGSFINKKPCSNDAYHRLYVGDIIKFGESTRMYIVEGPESQRPVEYDSANMQNYRRQLTEKSQKMEEEKKDIAEEGVSWGFREDAVNDDDIDEEKSDEELPDYISKDDNYDRKYGEKFASSLNDNDVSEKDQKLLEKVRKKERKIQNMQEEISRIYMKEGKQDEGLTPGQIAAVERNDKRIEVLKTEIVAMEEEIRGKQLQRSVNGSSGKEASKEKRGRERLDEDEDALDTTAETADASTNWRLKKKLQRTSGNQNVLGKLGYGESLTFESIRKDWEKKNAEVNSLNQEIRNLLEVVEANGNDNAGNVDEMDAFVQDTKVREAEARLKRVQADVETANAELSQITKLMKVAAPALASLHKLEKNSCPDTTGENLVTREQETEPILNKVSENIERRESESALLSDNNVSESDSFLSRSEFMSMSHVASTDVIKNSSNSQESAYDNSAKCRIEKNSDDKKITTGDKKISVDSTTDGQPDRVQIGPTICPATAKNVQYQSSTPADVSSTATSSHKNSKKRKADNSNSLNFSSSVLEGGDSVWCPPKNQSGDGKTHLNEKYGY